MSARITKCLILASMLVCGCAHAGGDPLDDPVIQRNLRAMRAVTTIAHPDVFGMTSGLRRYAHHDFKGAMAYFKEGAYYADKLSQLCIGLMYMNGEGVSKDLVTAYAWIDLASERKYPDFVATRNSLKARLTPDQLAKAQALRVDLEKKYGDAVAKHRMELKLRLGLMNAYTGSRTGYDSGIIQVKEPGTCEPLLIIGGHALPEAGCDHGAYLSKDNWKPELYFATRDAEWKDMRGTVTVGPLTDAGAAKKDAKSTAVEAAQPKH